MPADVDPPLNERSRRTRASLLEAAREAIEQEGLPALTMHGIAERAGVSRRAVYLHFDSRAELVAALFDHVTESARLSESTLPVWVAPDAVTALDRWAEHVARFHGDVIAATRAFEEVYRTDPDAAAHRDRYLRAQLAACRALIDRLEAEGRLAPAWTAQTASEMLFALVSTDLLERLIVERRWSRAKLAQHLALLYRATFVAADG